MPSNATVPFRPVSEASLSRRAIRPAKCPAHELSAACYKTKEPLPVSNTLRLGTGLLDEETHSKSIMSTTAAH